MAMDTPIDISVVIVTYNNLAIIQECLKTLSRVLAPYASEVIVIDNASSDGTAWNLGLIVHWRRRTFKRSEIILNSRNLGYTRAVNQGLRLCRGRFVLMLNPDIDFKDSPFPRLFELLEDERIAVVAPQLRFLDGRIQPSCRRFPAKRDVFFEVLGLSRLFFNSPFFNRWRMPDFDHQTSRDVEQPQGAFLLMRRSLIERIGLLDERFPMFFSDVDFCRRAAQAGRIHFCADVSVRHWQGDSVRQRRAAMILSSHRSFVDYFSKYDNGVWQRLSTFCVRVTLLAALPVRLLFLKIR